jgi:hypothetical protein
VKKNNGTEKRGQGPEWAGRAIEKMMVFICYFYFGAFIYVGNFSDFFSEGCECGPFALFLLLIMFACCVTFV